MKKLFSVILSVAILVGVTGCTTYKSYTYKVETGDKVEVKLNTTDGHDITSDLPFAISKDGTKMSQGIFITIDTYNQYVASVGTDSSSKILDTGSKDGITYTFYSYNDSEFDYLIKIDGSNTAVVLANGNSKEEAEDCFNKLSFSIAD